MMEEKYDEAMLKMKMEEKNREMNSVEQQKQTCS